MIQHYLLVHNVLVLSGAQSVVFKIKIEQAQRLRRDAILLILDVVQAS